MLRKRCLDFWAWPSAGIAVLGQPQVEAALKTGKISLLLLADDASEGLERSLTNKNRNNSLPLAGRVREGGLCM